MVGLFEKRHKITRLKIDLHHFGFFVMLLLDEIIYMSIRVTNHVHSIFTFFYGINSLLGCHNNQEDSYDITQP